NLKISELPDATLFHSAEWARVLAETYGYTPQYVSCSIPRGAVAFLPLMEVRSLFTGKRGISLPFSDDCVPLLKQGIHLSDILPFVHRLAADRHWKYIELRSNCDNLPSATPFNEFFSHQLTVETTEELQMKNLRDSTRR